MFDKNVVTGAILLLISLAGFIFAIWQGMHWIRESVLSKLRRALLPGLGLAICFLSGAIALGYLGLLGSAEDWNKEAIGSLLCVAFPLIVLTIIGIFVRFLLREPTLKFLSGRLDRVIEKSKKPK